MTLPLQNARVDTQVGHRKIYKIFSTALPVICDCQRPNRLLLPEAASPCLGVSSA